MKGNWLKNRQFVNVSSIESLVNIFSSYFSGVVLYDQKVPCFFVFMNLNRWQRYGLRVLWHLLQQEVLYLLMWFLFLLTMLQVENLLPICQRDQEGSLYRRLVLNGPKLKVQLSLVGLFNGTITGSKKVQQCLACTSFLLNWSKCDAYIWAKQRYLDSGRCNPTVMGYYLGLLLLLPLKQPVTTR